MFQHPDLNSSCFVFVSLDSSEVGAMAESGIGRSAEDSSFSPSVLTSSLLLAPRVADSREKRAFGMFVRCCC